MAEDKPKKKAIDDLLAMEKALEERLSRPAAQKKPDYEIPELEFERPRKQKAQQPRRVQVREESAEQPRKEEPKVEERGGIPVREITPVEKEKQKMPTMIEFPHITEDLKGIAPPTAEGGVRGIPLGFMVPEAERGKKIASEWEPVVPTTIDLRYPLIDPYAYAVIKWIEKSQEVTYTVIEPPLTKDEEATFDKLKTMIVDLLDINLMAIRDVSAVKDYLKGKLNQMILDYEVSVSEGQYNKILYYIYRNFLGLERIEPLIQDEQIEDISCDGVGVPIFVFHRKYGSLKTNLSFNNSDDLTKFVTKLAQRCGKHISVAEPLMDGALPDGSRVQATFSATGDIATKGSAFTIRKFTKDPLTIIDFINFGTIPATMAAYLWLAIEFRNSVLISGGTATGKTSCLNALSLFLHPESKIVSIEDTPELALPHEHWIAKIARTGYGPEDVIGKKRGEISMFDLLRAALRERPDELIVGEVRGKEAYVLFQGMATGHAGLCTIHAESIDAVVNRLITPPISLSTGLLQHLNLVLIMTLARVKGTDVRRIKQAVEVIGIDPKTERPITNELFRWIPAEDSYEFASDRSYILNKIVQEKGIPEKSVWEEMQRRIAILNWMRKEGIRYYKDVGRIIATYYKNPEDILRKIYGAEKYGNTNPGV